MRYYLTVFIIFSIITLQSCDDSGVIPSNVPKGIITFKQKNLKYIDPYVDGIFELWLRLDSSGTVTNYSLGRFNINQNGEMIDTLGGPIEFKYQGDTNKLYQSKLAFVTVEPPGDYNSEPSNSILLSGETSFKFDSIYANLTIGGSDALGTAGQVLLSGQHTYYIFNTPTSTQSLCKRGIWFCDSLGNSNFPAGLQMPNPGWVYEGWIVDTSNSQNHIFYSTGRFSNPYSADFDGPGACAGAQPPYQAPGQDWILDNCPSGKPPITNLTIGNYGILVTLEPSTEQFGSDAYNRPFFLSLFKQMEISPLTGCKGKALVPSQSIYLPSGSIKITYRPTLDK